MVRASLLVLSFLGCADDDRSSRDPCAGATCSGHGACLAEGPVARCECEVGFRATGLACVAVAEDAGPCADAGPSGDWTLETIATGAGNSQVPSLAIDRLAGVVHVAFHDETLGLVYVTNASGAWVSEAAGAGGFGDGISPSIALDPDGTPHVACESFHHIVHAVRTPAARWVFDPIDPSGGHAASLAISPDGVLHVAYEGPSGHLTYATDDGGAWTLETLDPEETTTAPSIAVASDGTPRVAFSKLDAGSWQGLRYASRDGAGTWEVVVPGDGGGSGAKPSLALDAQDRATVAYADYAETTLEVMTEGEADWTLATIVADGYVFGAPAIARAPDGVAHLAYHADAGGAAVYHGDDAGGDWSTELVERGPIGGFFATAASDDTVFIVYRGGQDVRIASRPLVPGDGGGCPDGGQ